MIPVAELRPAFAPLAAALAHRHRLDPQDLEQDVWLRVLERAADGTLPRDRVSWVRALTIQLTAQLAAGRGAPQPAPEPVGQPARQSVRRSGESRRQHPSVPSAEEQLLTAYRHRAVRRALAGLPGRCPELLAVLSESPELTYRQVAERLRLPRGSIGPTRSRCLGCLRALLYSHRPPSDTHHVGRPEG
ncbi:RNA polymerase sigma factor [Kitasatospora sp. NPDC056138]|uniref:RNA polymerase sigma factor n=1 Tax=Kitasatospora sp. NPDC056138 TaxID=3345724 RepID=UPI0035D90F4F